ncbi:polysaccharide biosynthesis/export family protein [Fulvivirgaceae bacterium BMA12]|uniref:Polysaccharide biosynthesis/export family protein n=1 Tax=Agaribacillus aureus TaxID=3051825 RepID=A0ABT8LEL1_9BACT|nr:polysaccharide biosynthesis/export family protein [Fulvivirgaceae bacterium BMA12]
MFKTENDILPDNVAAAVYEAEKNYIIQKNDYINVEVYTHGGERIIDPDFELLKETGLQANQMLNRPNPNYLIQQDGNVKLPMIGMVHLAGLTLQNSDIFLQKEYSKYYEDPFVITRYVNKRVIVLGATEGQVIPLENENTTLLEILALSGGLSNDSKAHNIRLIRGPLNNPQVYLIDLATVEGMSKTIKKILPGDIIYVEPVRRPLPESIRDLAPIVSLVTSGVALILSLGNL